MVSLPVVIRTLWVESWGGSVFVDFDLNRFQGMVMVVETKKKCVWTRKSVQVNGSG